jgi:glucose-6-phosphate isomerase
MGLLHLAIVGIDLKEVLAGAQDMAKRCLSPSLAKNPAGLYAVLHFLAYRKKGKSIGILMPFAESLKSTADWYCQLLAESLGKKFARKIVKRADGGEDWQQDPGRVVHIGRTPVPARGTSDLHSIQQNNIEGENNKAITMIRVERFSREVAVPSSEGLLSGRSLADLLTLAQEGTEWALTRAQRPNCAIVMPGLTPHAWSQLLFFFEWATAFEGELLGINAFDQPGVESYKNYMYYKLRKPGIPKAIADEIKKHPLKKERRWVV